MVLSCAVFALPLVPVVTRRLPFLWACSSTLARGMSLLLCPAVALNRRGREKREAKKDLLRFMLPLLCQLAVASIMWALAFINREENGTSLFVGDANST